MTNNEIIKALECCVNNGDCKECAINPHKGNYGYCTSLAIKQALALINRQQAEIERLNNTIYTFEKHFESVKAKEVRVFAERLKAKERPTFPLAMVIDVYEIDNLVKEMVGEG